MLVVNPLDAAFSDCVKAASLFMKNCLDIYL